jgi:hypothetical protein
MRYKVNLVHLTDLLSTFDQQCIKKSRGKGSKEKLVALEINFRSGTIQ